MSLFPILGRLEYDKSIKGNLTFGIGFGFGGYILHSASTTIENYTYVQDSNPWREGNTRRNVFRNYFTAVTHGGEGSITLAYRFKTFLSLGLTGRVFLISKIEDTWESSGYYQTDWDPAEPQLITIKNGYEYGGVGWGLAASISF